MLSIAFWTLHSKPISPCSQATALNFGEYMASGANRLDFLIVVSRSVLLFSVVP